MKRETNECTLEAEAFGVGCAPCDVSLNPHMFRECLRDLATRHLDIMRRACRRYVQNRHDADDLAQEVLVKAARACCARPGEEPAAGWLYRIAANHCHDHLRRRRRQDDLLGRHFAAGDLPGCFRETAPNDGPDIPDAECDALPDRLARGLCQQDRRIAHLRYVIGLKQDAIARVTGMTRPGVSKRLARIREHAARVYRLRSRGGARG